MTETLGQRIRALRKQKGLSGAALAMRIGCSEPAVSYWENDLRVPKPHWLGALSRFFGVSVRYLEMGASLGLQRERDDLRALHRAIRGGATQQQLLSMIGPGP